MSSSNVQCRLRLRARAAILGVVACVGIVTFAGHASAATTVYYDDAGPDAASIGIVGDSTLSGVRWYDTYGDLERYNFVFDAESCRRTIETSCWSREDYRAENAYGALQRLSGEWGDVLFVMMGYNDSRYMFDDAVDSVVAEARSQDIPHVVWLSLRTSGVSYEEPMHQANGNSYRESNRDLYQKADEYDGYLQIADWSSYSAGHDEWFEYDGVHLTIDGVRAITTFLANTADKVLAGQDVTPANPLWVTLETGDSGNTIAEAQEALLDAGVNSVGGADGVYGQQTAAAVSEFQEEQGLTVNGAVDAQTAAALGLHELAESEKPAEPVQEPAATTPAEPEVAVEAPAGVQVASVDTSTVDDSGGSRSTALLAVIPVALLALAVFNGRRRGQRLASRGPQRRTAPGGQRHPQPAQQRRLAAVPEPGGVPSQRKRQHPPERRAAVAPVSRRPALLPSPVHEPTALERALPMRMPYDYEQEEALAH